MVHLQVFIHFKCFKRKVRKLDESNSGYSRKFFFQNIGNVLLFYYIQAHKKTVHKKKRFVTSDYSPSIIGKNKYKCKHCDKSLTLKHIVWFVKHVKYCGVDDKKANQLLSPEDVEVKSAVEQSRNEVTYLYWRCFSFMIFCYPYCSQSK